MAKVYAEKRDELIERFKATFATHRSIAGAAAALARGIGFSNRTAEQHLRDFVADNPEFRPKRRGQGPA